MTFNSEHTGIITQVRMTSSRLPGKVLMKVNEKSLLEYHLDRLRLTGLQIFIATTVNKSDDIICDLAEKMKLNYFRGSEDNVLERFYGTAVKYELKHLVRVTSDCPLIDPSLIINGIEMYSRAGSENIYLSNAIERTFARGFDFEIFSFASLHDAYENVTDQSDLEHVTPYIWKNKSEKTKLIHYKQDVDHSNLRVTVDTQKDFELISELILTFQADKLSYSEIEKTLLNHPELIAINADIQQKKIN